MQLEKFTVFCEQCGRKNVKAINIDCPPPYVRCECGARYHLNLEEDAPRGMPAGSGSGNRTPAATQKGVLM